MVYKPRTPPSSPPTLRPLFNLPAIPHSRPSSDRRYTPPYPNATPADLFPTRINGCTVPAFRYINRTKALIYIDGSCLGNGHVGARAGYGIRWGPEQRYASPLDRRGPQTSNRAELKAAIVALGLRYWPGEGFESLVLACDSEYVVKGVCEWMRVWKANGWKTADGKDVLNRDLWELLAKKLADWNDKGLWVQFWRVPREWNEADELARSGAAMENRNGSGDGSGGDVGEVVALDI